MTYCAYYQAVVHKKDTWFLVATLRSFEHLAFDRTLDKERGLFEFFVPEAHEAVFLKLMHHFERMGLVQDIHKYPNRLAVPGATVEP